MSMMAFKVTRTLKQINVLKFLISALISIVFKRQREREKRFI